MVDLILDAGALLGESPSWSVADQRLYWVDIDRHLLHRTDPATGTDDSMAFDGPIGCVAQRRGGGWVIALRDGLALIDTWGGPVRPFGPRLLADHPEQRFNDGCVDGHGDLWVGSLTSDKANPAATLYRIAGDGAARVMLTGLTTSNGAAFSPDGGIFYHADTPRRSVHAYAINAATGELSAPRLMRHFPEPGGRPDGATVDAEGCYWCALWDGWSVVRLSPQGELLQTVALPVQRPTMVALGGPDLCTAFVTSAGKNLTDAERRDQPHAGGVFAFRVDTPGLPARAFAG